MQRITEHMRQMAAQLLESGAVDRVLGWQAGDLPYDNAPAWFAGDELDSLVYDGFCGANVSKFLVQGARDAKVLAFLKPCDSYSLNQLVTEHRVKRENVHAVGVGCSGMLDIDRARDLGVKGITGVKDNGATVVFETIYGEKALERADILLDKCRCCKGPEHATQDALIGQELTPPEPEDRFAGVAQLEALTAEERFAFWQGELSKCIRCNACRNACPACTCIQCVFDNDHSGVKTKASADDFEDNLYHIIRAYHVAGRCTDCGECTRVCPQGIPLHLLNRKFISDINDLYGEYQAGAVTDGKSPLTEYTKEDAEPSVVLERGGAK